MGIGLTEEHRALAASVRGLAERTTAHTALAGQGLLGLHLPEAYGGQGYGLPELSVALETLAELRAPGDYLPDVIVSAALARSTILRAPAPADPPRVPEAADPRRTPEAADPPHAPEAADPRRTPEAAGPWRAPDPPDPADPADPAAAELRRLIGGLADGSLAAAVALSSTAGGALLALGRADADLFLLPAGNGGWALAEAAQVTAETVADIDLDRSLCEIRSFDSAGARPLGALPVRELAAVLLGADSCGVAAWAVATAADHAKVREQFGRPIGQFQGVKHRVAAALVTLEQARAAVWDAARALDGNACRKREENPGDANGQNPHSGDNRDASGADAHGTRSTEDRNALGADVQEAPGVGGADVGLAVGVAGVLAGEAGVRCAADAIQVLGGIGYTFEHPAHRYYRRALSDRALAGDPGEWAEEVAGAALAGVRRRMEPDLPEEAEPLRDEIRAQAASLRAEEPAARLGRFAREGWIMPYLPEPWGRAAPPLEQVIIHQEFRGLRRPNLGIAAWAVPSLVKYGTRDQQERFLPKTFAREIVWCQLFSEPGAGSDLAGLSTKAVRVEGGWSLTGQKIWTSLAQHAHWGICLARTSPDKSKHEGITYFLVDMSGPGVTVRPLKEINGDEVFNEVFLDDVFVPDDLVVGEVDQGWRVARDTLSHERVALGDSWGPGVQHTDLAAYVAGLPGLRPSQREQTGRLWAEGQAISALGLRVTLSQLSGGDPGTASSVRKLLGMRHAQAVAEFCWSLDPSNRHWSRMILATRAFTIGGGTTEVQLNIIAERALGLPRDP